MFYPHRIRLRDPWQREPLPSGGTRYRRGFQCPTGLDSQERVWLVIEGGTPYAVSLNGEPLQAFAASDRIVAYEITARLRPRNELQIDQAGELGEVRLEIRLHSEPEV